MASGRCIRSWTRVGAAAPGGFIAAIDDSTTLLFFLSFLLFVWSAKRRFLRKLKQGAGGGVGVLSLEEAVEGRERGGWCPGRVDRSPRLAGVRAGAVTLVCHECGEDIDDLFL